MLIENASLNADTSASTETAEGQELASAGGAGETLTADPRYAGKKPEELIAIINEKEKFIGAQASEAVGRVRSLEERLDRTLGMLESRRIESAELPEKREEKPKFDLEDPEGSVERMIEARLSQERKQAAARDGQSWAADAKARFESAKEVAYREDKKLYDGIERDVETAIFTGLRQGTITKEVAGNPATWRAVGRHIRSERGEFDRTVPQKRQPMAGVSTGEPGSVRRLGADDDDTVIDEGTREEMRRWNIDSKKATEAIKIGKTMKARGELK